MYQSRLESTREFRYSVWVKAFCKNNERCSLSSLLHTLILHLSLRPPVLINIAPPPSLLRGYPSVRPSIHPISSIRPTTAENKTRRETKKKKKKKGKGKKKKERIKEEKAQENHLHTALLPRHLRRRRRRRRRQRRRGRAHLTSASAFPPLRTHLLHSLLSTFSLSFLCGGGGGGGGICQFSAPPRSRSEVVVVVQIVACGH
ncbi:hypothetical protein IWX49DRAFT_392638 [Phyllosticta citricarpa]